MTDALGMGFRPPNGGRNPHPVVVTPGLTRGLVG